jgi:branched-chain amino acid transport system substrate-binding protein
MRASWLLVIAIIALLQTKHLSAAPEAGRGTVTLGGIFCLTGEVASGCNAIREGAEIGLDLINSSGGINGRPLKLDIQDSQFAPRNAHTLAKRFSSNRDVFGILITSIIETKAAASVLERAHIPYLTLWDSAPAIEALGDYSFGIGPWLPATYEVAAEYSFSNLSARRAAVIATTSEWALEVGAGFKSHFAKLGGAIVAHEEVDPSDSDFRAVLIRLIKSNPEVIYAPITSHLIPFFKQLNQLGYVGKIITSDNLTEELIQQSASVFEGVYQTMVADPDTPDSNRLRQLYKKRFLKEPTMLAFNSWGYDGIRLMAQGLIDAETKKILLREALLAIRDFSGAGGNISFSTEGSWRMPLEVFQVRGGKLMRGQPLKAGK